MIYTISAIIVLAIWPVLIPDASLYFLVFGMACFYATLAMAWNIYALTGQLSLGHAAFFGLGAYGAVLLEQYLHWPVYVCILMGGLAGAAYGVLWSLTFNRIRGPYFALATLASMEIPKVIIDNWDSFTSGSLGIVGISRLPAWVIGNLRIAWGEDLRAQYYLLLILMLLVGLIHQRTMSSKWGWRLRAIREEEQAAAMLGVNVWGGRFQALLLSSYLTSLCGGLYAHIVGLIEPALVFNLQLAAFPLVLTLFGGRFQFFGPVLGAFILYPLDQLILQPLLPQGHAAIYGLIIIMTIIFFPRGVAQWFRKGTKLS
jgi:branched-chain amino acid transport system permease protein